MKYIKLFEEYNTDYEYEVVDILERLIEGYPIKLSDLDVVYDYFDGEIPDEYLYSGILYRFVFFDNHNDYQLALNNGIGCKDDYFLRCTKSLDNSDIIIEQLGTGYDYYIIFELSINTDECIFDVNKLCGHFGVTSYYGHEEEVLVECENLSPSQIIENDEL